MALFFAVCDNGWPDGAIIVSRRWRFFMRLALLHSGARRWRFIGLEQRNFRQKRKANGQEPTAFQKKPPAPRGKVQAVMAFN
jgi:hypothetical protein